MCMRDDDRIYGRETEVPNGLALLDMLVPEPVIEEPKLELPELRVDEHGRLIVDFDEHGRLILDLKDEPQSDRPVVIDMLPDGKLVEMVEIPGHPFFIGCQFHPELKSRLVAPHPLFNAFVKAALTHRGSATAGEKKRPAAEKPRKVVKDDLPEVDGAAAEPTAAEVPPRNGVHKTAAAKPKTKPVRRRVAR